MVCKFIIEGAKFRLLVQYAKYLSEECPAVSDMPSEIYSSIARQLDVNAAIESWRIEVTDFAQCFVSDEESVFYKVFRLKARGALYSKLVSILSKSTNLSMPEIDDVILFTLLWENSSNVGLAALVRSKDPNLLSWEYECGSLEMAQEFREVFDGIFGSRYVKQRILSM